MKHWHLTGIQISITHNTNKKSSTNQSLTDCSHSPPVNTNSYWEKYVLLKLHDHTKSNFPQHTIQDQEL